MAQAVADGVRMLNGTSKAIRTNESYRATSYSRVRRPATSSSSEPGDSLPRRTQIQGSAFCIRGVRAAEGFSESPTRSLYRLIVEIARQNHRGAAERKKYNTSTEMPSSFASRSSTEFSGGVESIVFKVVEVRCHRLTAISATDPFRDVLLLQSGRLAGGHDIFVSSCVPKIAPFLVPPLAS